VVIGSGVAKRPITEPPPASQPPSLPKSFAVIGGIENRHPYVCDVALQEDASRIRRKPGIFARLRSFALNILRKTKITNGSEALYDNALRLDNLPDLVGVF
jgi:hypothetical protein